MRRPSAPPSTVWLCLLGAILCLFGAQVGRHWDFTVDDAGISFAYARNLAAGHGLVLTPGSERVEAATDFLWVLLLSPADALGIRHETLAKLLGLCFSGGALAGIALFPAVAYRRKPGYYDLVAPLAAALFAHTALWAAAGLENGLFQCLVVTALLLLAWEEHDGSRAPWSAVALAAVFATRPDGALYAVALGGAKALRGLSGNARRQDAVWATILAVLVGSLELFRLAYFAYPLPNSFYIKRKTFQFGEGFFDKDSAGWVYVREWVVAYGFEKALILIPCAALGLRAPVARAGLLLALVAGFFLPVYSHGDWMEEWRFLTFCAPLLALGVAEGARALARIGVAVTPRSLRGGVALVLTPAAAWLTLSLATKAYPARMEITRTHTTLEFATVRSRARYFAAAAQATEVDDGSVLDPDVGGQSYDSGLRVVDLYGLGDTAIAHSHGDDEPGMREVIFHERRPTFVHLHGAWFGAVQLDRLEELTDLYFHLPPYIHNERDDGVDYVRRESVAAPWTEECERGPAFSTHGTTYVDGYTVSARGVEPGQTVTLELTLAGVALGGSGVLMAVPTLGADKPGGGGRGVEIPVHPAGEVLAGVNVLPGERLRARVHLHLTRGTYELKWRNDGAEASLGTVTVWRGTGVRELAALQSGMSQALAGGRMHDARLLALSLRLRVMDNPTDTTARGILALYARALADRARVMGEHQAFRVATDLALQARAFGREDGPTVVQVEGLAERMADAARDERRHGTVARAFTLARDAVTIDPRRSWMRRQAEELRASRTGVYDGGRDAVAYRTAAAALSGGATVETALAWLGSTERWVEAAALADRTGTRPTTPLAALAVARGYLSRGEVAEAQALVNAIPCATHRDPDLARAFEALTGHGYRRNDPVCSQDLPPPAAPFNPDEGSFERGRWLGWHATGGSFAAGPAHDLPHGETFVNGWQGQYYANSWGAGDPSTGVLRSRPFTVSMDAISFLVGGGSDTGHEGVRLMVDGVAVLRAAGQNVEALHRAVWDVRPWHGRTATLEIYDESTEGWGHILADDFRVEPAVPVLPTP